MSNVNGKLYEVSKEFFERTGDVKRFNDLLQNVKVTERKSGKDLLGVIQIPLDMLCFPEYQKPRLNHIRENKLNQLIFNFDSLLAGYIDVIPNPENGSFEVCEGMGRTLAAAINGFNYMWANVHLNVPVGKSEEYGAKLFSNQSIYNAVVRPVESHSCRVLLKDPDTVILDKVAKKHGVILTPTKEDYQAGRKIVRCYNEALKIVRCGGKEALEFAFNVVEKAGWDIETFGYSAYVLRMMRFVWFAYGKEPGIISVFSKILKQYDPTHFKAEALSKYSLRDGRSACCLLAGDLLSQKYGISNRILLHNNKMSIA